MAMKWGCAPWGGMAWGAPVRNIRTTALPNPPPQALIEWDATSPETYVFVVFVDGVLYGTTRDTQMVVAPGHSGRFYFEVFALAAGYEEKATLLAACLDPIRGDRIQLRWQRATGGGGWGLALWGLSQWASIEGAENVTFRIMWDEGVGTSPLVLLDIISAEDAFDTDEAAFFYTTEALVDGTYEFRVDPVDEAGNVLTPSAFTVVHVHDPAPLPPSNFVITGFAPGPEEFTATWDASPSGDVVEYRIFDNGGTGGEVDYITPVATVAAPATSHTWTRAGAAAGDWVVAIRAVDAVGEEENVHVLYAFDLEGAPLAVLTPPPAIPRNVIATPIAGAAFRLEADYLAEEEEAVGVKINFYNNGGIQNDPIDFGTVIAFAVLDAHEFQAPLTLSVEVDTAGLIDGGVYQWAAKSETGAGRESDASDITPEVLADGTPPDDHASLTAMSVV